MNQQPLWPYKVNKVQVSEGLVFWELRPDAPVGELNEVTGSRYILMDCIDTDEIIPYGKPRTPLTIALMLMAYFEAETEDPRTKDMETLRSLIPFLEANEFTDEASSVLYDIRLEISSLYTVLASLKNQATYVEQLIVREFSKRETK